MTGASTWSEFNPNPAGRRVGDCSVRAIAAALGLTWDEAFDEIAQAAKWMADMPSSDAVWGAVLRKNGFYRSAIPNACPMCYTAGDFAKAHPHGIYVLGFGGHVATVVDGVIYDAWDSTGEVPQYCWYKKEA